MSETTVLTKSEIMVLQMLRDAKYHSITVTKKKGIVELLQGTERISEKARIIDVLKDHSYQNIELKQADGKIVFLNRTVQTKL